MTQNNAGNKSGDEAVQAFIELRETVARLRAEDGCPWDRAQTHETLKPECVEEAAEVICGINILRETGSPDSLIEELGDLLLQVLMHAQIGEEEGLFSLSQVISCVNEKMVRRHPHVFGDKSLEYIRKLKEKNRTSSEQTEKEYAAGTGLGQEADTSVPADWKYIKSLEKQGREWEEEYLFRAFDESAKLIEVARERKRKKA